MYQAVPSTGGKTEANEECVWANAKNVGSSKRRVVRQEYMMNMQVWIGYNWTSQRQMKKD